MHELALMEAVFQQVEAYAPRFATIQSVELRIGPLQMIDRDALSLAWSAVTRGTRADGAELRTHWPPPHRECPVCGRRWIGGELLETCTCGERRPRWIDGDELVLLSIQAEVPDQTESAEPFGPRSEP